MVGDTRVVIKIKYGKSGHKCCFYLAAKEAAYTRH